MTMARRVYLSLLFACLLYNEGSEAAGTLAKDHGDVCTESKCSKVANRILSQLDKSYNPCDNFYQYACGGWMSHHKIPEGKEEYSGIAELSDVVETTLKRELNKTQRSDTFTIKKIKDFYQSCLDVKKINNLGAGPLKRMIKNIGSWDVNPSWKAASWDFSSTLRLLHKSYPAEIFFTVDVDVDPKDRNHNILTIDQAKLSLPQIVYYTNKEVLKSLVDYATSIAAITEGIKEPADNPEMYEQINEKMREMVNFEVKLAKIAVPKVAKRYARVTIEKLSKALPEFPWLEHIQDVLAPRKITKDMKIVVLSNDYLADMMKLINTTEKSIVNNYMTWRLVKDMVPFLSFDFTNRYNEFKTLLTGVKINKSRADICFKYTDEILGPLVGALFIRTSFSPDDKAEVEEMMELIVKAFERNAETVDWISKQTIKSVKEKADAATIKVGYPDYLYNETKFRERYRGIMIRPGTFFDNVARIDRFSNTRTFKKLDNPVDPHQWVSVPHMVNAFYVVTKNEILIPAGILQPPFFYSEPIPRSLSYGAIGHVLGHELTHGFDTLGRRFNKLGKLIQKRTKWSGDSIKAFEKRARCLARQFNRYKIGKTLHIDGKNTLGENIADGGGVKLSWMAYQNWVNGNGKEYILPTLNKTNDELFFIGYAQKECHVSTKKALLLSITDDVHAPSMFRIIGTLSNSKEFAEAFNCPIGSNMNPADKCEVW